MLFEFIHCESKLYNKEMAFYCPVTSNATSYYYPAIGLPVFVCTLFMIACNKFSEVLLSRLFSGYKELSTSKITSTILRKLLALAIVLIGIFRFGKAILETLLCPSMFYLMYAAFATSTLSLEGRLLIFCLSGGVCGMYLVELSIKKLPGPLGLSHYDYGRSSLWDVQNRLDSKYVCLKGILLLKASADTLCSL